MPSLPRGVAAPHLTPATLAAASPITVTSAYGYELRDSYGCHGSTTAGYLLSDRPVGYANLETTRSAVNTALNRDAAARRADAAAAAGPEPVFDRGFPGTRAEFEQDHAAWKKARDRAEAADSLTRADAWAAHGFELVDTNGVSAANSPHTDERDALLVLGHEDTHWCRCGHSGATLDDPDDLDPDDPTDAGRCEPRPLAVVAAGPWRWLTTPDLLEHPDPASEARTRLLRLAEEWQTALDRHATDVAELTAAVDALPTEEQLAEMRADAYHAAVAARGDVSRLRSKLRGLQRETAGTLLDAVSRRHKLVPTVPGFVDRNDYGWRRGKYRTVAEELCGTPDVGTGRG